ncbi:MAG: hypothetical protein ACFFDF_25890, partial [Candidatus Odinarchaeota archaeon]
RFESESLDPTINRSFRIEFENGRLPPVPEILWKYRGQGIEIEYTYAKNRPNLGTDKSNWAQDYFPEYFRKMANKYNLIKSGGSDYHGGKKNIVMGEANVPIKYLKSFI